MKCPPDLAHQKYAKIKANLVVAFSKKENPSVLLQGLINENS